VRPKHVKDMVAKLRAAKKAPRTMRNVYWTLKATYRAAQIDECALDRSTLRPDDE